MIVVVASVSGFLIHTGAVATGSGAIGGSAGLVVGALARDLRIDVDHWELERKAFVLGVLFGVLFTAFE